MLSDLKKVLFFILAAETVFRGLALILELFFKNPYMPVLVLVFNLIMLCGGIAVTVTWFMKRARMSMIQMFFAIDLFFALFSLYYFANYSLLEMYWFEFPLTGNFLSILIYIFALFFSCRRSRYIRIKSDFCDTDKK